MSKPVYDDRRYILTNGVLLHTIFAGPEDGEPVFLLHGFPEFWYGWRHQIPYLADQGYRVIVPDQRGYNLSDKPRSVAHYRISTLARDIIGLADALGYDRFNLVGHDWGAAVSWWVATMFPERLKKLIILNVPYPAIMAQELQQFNMGQLRKSWYMLFFQIPALPESVLSSNNYQGFLDSIQKSGNPDTFSNDDLEQLRRAWSRPGAMSGMLNWYRALIRGSRRASSGDSQRVRLSQADSEKPRITVPTLMLWGEQDIALSKDLAQPSIDLCEDGELIFFPDATHWLQHDEPEAVNQHIHRFISDDKSRENEQQSDQVSDS